MLAASFSNSSSGEGIGWTADERNPVVDGWLDTSNSLVWDPDARLYAVFGLPPAGTTGEEQPATISRAPQSG